jgi:tetratricopeptide (TPR) repeat protein
MGDEAVAARFNRRPLAEASARQALGEASLALGRYDLAEQQLRRVTMLRTKHLGTAHPETLTAERLLVRALCPWGVSAEAKPDVAEPIARRVLEVHRRNLGPSDPRTLASMTALGHVLATKSADDGRVEAERALLMDEAVRLLQVALDVQVRTLGPVHLETLESQSILGLALLRKGDAAGAEGVLRLAAERQSQALGPAHPLTLQSMKYLAAALHSLKKFDEASRLAVDAADGHLHTFGACHIQTASALGTARWVLQGAGNSAAFRELCERWLREILATPADTDPFLRYRRSVRLAFLAADFVLLPTPNPIDADLAIRAAEEAVALYGDWDDVWVCLAVVYYRLDRLDDAMRAIETSMARPRWKGGDGADWLVIAAIHARRGDLHQSRGWYDRALNKDPKREAWQSYLQPLREEVATLLGGDD